MPGPPDDFARASRDAVRQLRRMPAELRRTAGATVRDRVAGDAAHAIRQSFTGPWSMRLAEGTRVRVDVSPTVVVGGARSVVSGGASVRQLVYGDQWGGGKRSATVTRSTRSGGRTTYRIRSTQQFRTRGSNSIYRTLHGHADELYRSWLSVLDPYLDEWEG